MLQHCKHGLKSFFKAFGSAVDVPAFGGRLILDIDNTVKPIYGHQEGAGLGYNPMKPGRPSHNYHSFFIGRARISLGVEVLPGKQHSGRCGMKRLWSLIDSLPPHLWTKRRAGQSSSAMLFAESCFPTPH